MSHDVTAACLFCSLSSSRSVGSLNCGCAMIPLTTVTRCPKSLTRCQHRLFTSISFKSRATSVICINFFSGIPYCFCFSLQVLDIHYQGHPERDLVKLHAEIHFPNIDFSSMAVDFGCVLNYTETRKEICITNCSPMSVSYRWTFLVDEERKYVSTEKCVVSVKHCFCTNNIPEHCFAAVSS